jgi:hypothetical protein
MSENLSSDAIVRAFGQLGIKLSLREKFDEHSTLIGVMHVLVFTTLRPLRELTLYISEVRITFIVEDEGMTHRALYNLEYVHRESLDSFIEGVRGLSGLLDALKGGEVIDTPIDWRDYK